MPKLLSFFFLLAIVVRINNVEISISQEYLDRFKMLAQIGSISNYWIGPNLLEGRTNDLFFTSIIELKKVIKDSK